MELFSTHGFNASIGFKKDAVSGFLSKMSKFWNFLDNISWLGTSFSELIFALKSRSGTTPWSWTQSPNCDDDRIGFETQKNPVFVSVSKIVTCSFFRAATDCQRSFGPLVLDKIGLCNTFCVLVQFWLHYFCQSCFTLLVFQALPGLVPF